MTGTKRTRTAIIGCKSTTRYLYQSLRSTIAIDSIVTIDPDTADRNQVADYDDLGDLGSTVQVHVARTYALSTPEDLAMFTRAPYDIALVAGWQRLIPDAVLQTLRVGAFGMHGSSENLPKGRGRSPLNWGLIEGRQWFFTNLFRYAPGIDDGPVVDPACFSINHSDTAETLHFKNLLAMVQLVKKNVAGLVDGTTALQPQPGAEPTYYPKRTPDDSIVDWSLGVFELDRHIRAVAPPFNGAFSFIGDGLVRLIRASIFYTDVESHPFQCSQPGEICGVFPNGKFVVRVNGGALLVHEFEDLDGVVVEGAVFTSPEANIRRFPRNDRGYLDLPVPR